MEITRVAPFLEYLDRVHERTRRIVQLIGDDDLEWEAGPGRMTPGDLVRHLAGIERYMYAENVHGRPVRYPVTDGRSPTAAPRRSTTTIVFIAKPEICSLGSPTRASAKSV